MKIKPYIYKKTLVLTGKYYIGKHNGKNPNYKGSGTDWMIDCKKYVKKWKEDVITEILEYVDDSEKLKLRETYWLKEFDAANDILSYNRSNISQGCHITKESTKILQHNSSPKKIKILQYNLNGGFMKLWDSLASAGKYYNISTGDLCCCCKGKQQTVKGYIWKYFTENYSNNIEKKEPYSKTKEYRKACSLRMIGKKWPTEHFEFRRKPIYQLDKKENIIEKFNSIRDACLQFGLDIEKIESNIGGCLRNKQKTAYGFKWKYQ